MSRALFAFAAAGILSAGALLSASTRPALADGFSDMMIGYRFGSSYREPANPGNISKNIIDFQYVNGGKYGGNFLNVDTLISDAKDPAASGGGGAQEIYLVYRHEFSLGGLTGHSWAFGPVRNVGLTVGGDLNTKNDAFGARVRKLVVGPTFEFRMKGYANLTLGAIMENNHNAIVNNLNITNPNPVPGALLNPAIPGTSNVVFTPAYRVEAAWGLPFKMGLPVKFQGFANYTGPKGKDGFGAQTVPELLTESSLMIDVGSTTGKAGKVFVGLGYQFWKNKFGNAPGVGTQANVLQVLTELHI